LIEMALHLVLGKIGKLLRAFAGGQIGRRQRQSPECGTIIDIVTFKRIGQKGAFAIEVLQTRSAVNRQVSCGLPAIPITPCEY
jgi:hypothetical protein